MVPFSRGHRAGVLRRELPEWWLFVVAGSTSQSLAPKWPLTLENVQCCYVFASLKLITNIIRNPGLLFGMFVWENDRFLQS